MQELLDKWGIKIDYNTILAKWNESHRGYHTQTHLLDVIDQINEQRLDISQMDYEKLILCGLFHDIIYDPASQTNEEDSADFFMKCVSDRQNFEHINDIKQMILDTKTHEAQTPLSEKFNEIDMKIVERDYDSLLEWEEGIHKEFGSVYPDEMYKIGRLQFLESLMDKYPNNSDNLLKLVDYVKENY